MSLHAPQSLGSQKTRPILHALSSDRIAPPRAGRLACRAERVAVKIRKPLGIVLAEQPGGKKGVFVEEVTPGGNADKSGKVKAGDHLLRCSAVVLKRGKEGEYEREGYGARPYTNWETVVFDCRDQSYDDIMRAINSNSERWGIFYISLELQRDE